MPFLFLDELGSEPLSFIGGISTDIKPPVIIDPSVPRYLDTSFDDRYLITDYEDRTSIDAPNCSG